MCRWVPGTSLSPWPFPHPMTWSRNHCCYSPCSSPPTPWLRQCDLGQKTGGARTPRGPLPKRTSPRPALGVFMDSRGPRNLLKLPPSSCMCVHRCIFLRSVPMDFPSFLQRPLTPKGSEPLLWVGDQQVPGYQSLPFLSLVHLSCCRQLPPCSPWGHSTHPEGSQWFPLTSWLSLASARQCSCAPTGTPWSHSLGAPLLPSSAVMFPPPPSAWCMLTLVGSVDLWGQE